MDNGFRWLTVSPKGQPDFQLILMKVDGTNIKPEAAAALKSFWKAVASVRRRVSNLTIASATYGDLKAKLVQHLDGSRKMTAEMI